MFKKASAIHRAAAGLPWAPHCWSPRTTRLMPRPHRTSDGGNYDYGRVLRRGNYDVYARLLSRHINRHLPGNPNVVVATCPAPEG